MLKHLKRTLRTGKARKLFLTAVMAVLMLGTTIAVYADVYYFGDLLDQYGNKTATIFLVCNSSAGDFFYTCDNNNNCTDADHSRIASCVCGNGC